MFGYSSQSGLLSGGTWLKILSEPWLLLWISFACLLGFSLIMSDSLFYKVSSCFGRVVYLAKTSLKELKSLTEFWFMSKGNSRHPFSSSTSKNGKGQHKQYIWLSSLHLSSVGGGHCSYSYWLSWVLLYPKLNHTRSFSVVLLFVDSIINTLWHCFSNLLPFPSSKITSLVQLWHPQGPHGEKKSRLAVREKRVPVPIMLLSVKLYCLK